MKNRFIKLGRLFFALLISVPFNDVLAQQLAPAYPLITHDAYFSIWSQTDNLNGSTTKHWTGKDQSLIGIIKVDNNYYRFLGAPKDVYKTIANDTTSSISYTVNQPEKDWNAKGFDDAGWQESRVPLDYKNAKEIWARQRFELRDKEDQHLYLQLQNSGKANVFINGHKISLEGKMNNRDFSYIDLSSMKPSLMNGKNVLAIHCTARGKKGFLNASIVTKVTSSDANKISLATQTNCKFTATQTKYNFRCGAVDLQVAFISPLLLKDLSVLSRPVSYVSFNVQSNDKKVHKVQIYFGASSDIAVNTPEEEVSACVVSDHNLKMLKTGTVDQPVLQKKGDNIRIDWGQFYVGASDKNNVQQYISSSEQSGIASFLSGKNTGSNNLKGESLMLNTILDFDKVASLWKTDFVELGYDEAYMVQYFHQNLRPWWNKDGNSNMATQMLLAYNDYNVVKEKCNAFDKQLYQDALKAGGEDYARLCNIAYRQSIAAHALVQSPQGDLLFLSKENFSNGSINTVDVTYPSAPLYLIYNPDLLKGMLNGIFYYSESGQWKKPFPAHDLGTYPIANGQTYGEDMPVEEAGNMILLTAAISKVAGNADYAKKHWKELTKWVSYLAKEGLDPVNQLCTDDFAGHLARNANLSVKAILAIGSYGMMADMLGEKETGNSYILMARQMALKWMSLAGAGNHYALTFNDKNTWSEKYNLIWDKVLQLNIFPKSVLEKEVAFYLTKQNKYGLPLDSRKAYTKSDWIIWTASLADDKATFKKFVTPIYLFATQTPDRVPMSDWHQTISGKHVGFQARSVVGGYFMKMLANDFFGH